MGPCRAEAALSFEGGRALRPEERPQDVSVDPRGALPAEGARQAAPARACGPESPAQKRDVAACL